MMPIVQVSPGWVDKPTRLAMLKAGYLVVEVPEGQSVTVIVRLLRFLKEGL